MAIQLVNVGLIENDGTGDDLREAFIKVNENFSELSLLVTESTTVSNIGTGVGLFSEQENYNLKFKTLVEGNAVSLTSSTNEIVISVNDILNSINLTADTGTQLISGYGSLSIVGEDSISTELIGNSLKITSNFNQLSNDLSPTLGGTLDASNFSIINLSSINGTSLNNLNQIVGDNFDFGSITNEIKNIIDWFIYNTNIDMGTFSQPTQVIIDVGVF